MAKDVDEALLAVLRSEGGLSEERAAEYLGELKSERRYQRDVY
jgi:sulfite reductase (NADPH) flavoprotein alpha-component